MGFLDNAKAAASNLAAKADSALAGAMAGGPRPADVDKYLHDLGVLHFQELTGRPVDGAERERVLAALRDADAQNAVGFTLQTATPPPPPAPGMAGAVPPPAPGMAGQAAPPAPGMAGAVPPPPGMAGQATPPPAPGVAAATPPPPMPGTVPAEAPVEEAPPAPAAPATPPPPPSWA